MVLTFTTGAGLGVGTGGGVGFVVGWVLLGTPTFITSDTLYSSSIKGSKLCLSRNGLSCGAIHRDERSNGSREMGVMV